MAHAKLLHANSSTMLLRKLPTYMLDLAPVHAAQVEAREKAKAQLTREQK